MTEPINTAILSYGMSGEVFHAPLLASLPGFAIHTIVQRSKDKARLHYPRAKVVRSVDEAIGDPEVELVIVNTPNETHFDFAARALSFGKHVVVEKPFTVTSEEAEKLIRLAKEKGLVLTVFQNRRLDGDFLTIQRIVRDRRVGHLVEYEAHYDRFRNYVEPDTWKEENRPGTGILYNLGSHMLDQAVVLFGMPRYLDARIGIRRPGGTVDDYYDIRMEYPEHLAIIKSSYLVRQDLPRYILHGTEGSFVKYGLDPQEQDLKDKKDPNAKGWGVDPEPFWGRLNVIHGEELVETDPGNYAAFYRNVHDAIRNKVPLMVSPESSADVIRLIEACYQSAREKRVVRIV